MSQYDNTSPHIMIGGSGPDWLLGFKIGEDTWSGWLFRLGLLYSCNSGWLFGLSKVEGSEPDWL